MDPCSLRSSTDDAYWLDGGLAPRRVQPAARLRIEAPCHRIVFRRMAADRELAKPHRGVATARPRSTLFPRLFPRQAPRLAAVGVTLRFLRWAA